MSHAQRWGSMLLLVCFVLLALFSVVGYVTAGSLQAPGYRTAAWVYIGLFAFSLSGLVGVLVWRGRRKDGSRPVI
jgi:hypothetical protein